MAIRTRSLTRKSEAQSNYQPTISTQEQTQYKGNTHDKGNAYEKPSFDRRKGKADITILSSRVMSGGGTVYHDVFVTYVGGSTVDFKLSSGRRITAPTNYCLIEWK